MGHATIDMRKVLTSIGRLKVDTRLGPIFLGDLERIREIDMPLLEYFGIDMPLLGGLSIVVSILGN